MATFSSHISRDLARQYGEEAVRIIERGSYMAPSGNPVGIADLVEHSLRATVSYPPTRPLPADHAGPYDTRIVVENATTLAAARRLVDAGTNPVALNFASSTHPGGGFLSGARAQEEYLCRSSGLYACLRGNPMYDYHRANRDAFATDYVLYSPDVPVFRADDGTLLETPYTVAIITSAAVHCSYVPSERLAQIGPAMWTRILKVLAAGVAHGHDSIVLGAWGCGAFGCNGEEIAGLFRKALDENFRGAYKGVAFAIVDWSDEQKFIGPFDKVFGVHAQES